MHPFRLYLICNLAFIILRISERTHDEKLALRSHLIQDDLSNITEHIQFIWWGLYCWWYDQPCIFTKFLYSFKTNFFILFPIHSWRMQQPMSWEKLGWFTNIRNWYEIRTREEYENTSRNSLVQFTSKNWSFKIKGIFKW